MMKIIALGDTHGRTAWKQIIRENDFDKIVFIGDYFDTHERISARQQKENFKDIIAFKKANMDKVILLMGNHDYHYTDAVNEPYGGFQPKEKNAIMKLLLSAIDEELLQICFVWKKFLFTHAGVTKTWCRNHNVQTDFIEHSINTLFKLKLTCTLRIAPIFYYSINTLFKLKPEAFDFALGQTNDLTGDDPEQSPIWVRPASLQRDRIEGYMQIVGHTVQDRITFLGNKIFLIDTLGESGQFLILENGRAEVGKINET
jgi:predicted MPP superfamily phosphohydrolase